MREDRFSRRHFFYGALAAGAVPAGGFGSVASLKRLGYKSPNEKLNIGSIGAGGRAEVDLAGCQTENVVALADPDDERAAPTFKKYEKAAKYKDFRRMLDAERNNIDAVIVAPPDHMHGIAAKWAMERGKHVYCEKPLTRTVWEARQLAEAAARYRVATQMGNQGYSNEGARVAAEIIWSGEIGDVREVHAWTNRPIWPQGILTVPPEEKVPSTLDWDLWLGIAAHRPFISGGPNYYENGYGYYVPFNWRGFFDFGCGALGDMACHILGSVNMALMLEAPVSVEVLQQDGKNSQTFPATSKTRFEFPARRNMPPVTVYWYDACKDAPFRPPNLPKDERLIGPGLQIEPETPDDAPPKPAAQNNGAMFIGEKGILTTDTYAANVRLLPSERMNEYKLPPRLLTRSPGHHRDWIRACKGGQEGCSNFGVAAPFTEWVVLGCIALRFEGKLEWDSAAMRFTNNRGANAYLKPIFRKGWKFA